MRRHDRPNSQRASGRNLPQLGARGAPSRLFREYADERAAEARALLARELFTGAAYLSGYAVELLLKALIAERSLGQHFPVVDVPEELKIHNLEKLLVISGQLARLKAAFASNPELEDNLIVLRSWGPHFRYDRLRAQRARDIVYAVTDQRNGVMAWLKGLPSPYG
jgi:hypothetical protein